jgi:hypothetical protein
MFSMSVSRIGKFDPLDVAAPDPKGPLDRKSVEAIGRALEAHYADLVQAPLPDKFVELLGRLEGEDKVSKPQGRGDAHG